MPRYEKGSKEAIAWAAKMKQAREAKKGIKGGMVPDAPFGLSQGGKKLSLKRGRSPTPPPTPLPAAAPSPQIPDVDFKSLAPAPLSNMSGMVKKKPFAIRQTGTGAKKKISKNIMLGGYLQPGEFPPAAGINPTDDAPAFIQEPDGSELSIEGEGMCHCETCKMCGGRLKMKGLTKGLAKAAKALNPMSYALNNKGTRDLMIQSGQFTNDYALPAAVSAGMPLYYGAAGTAGMMLGGPAGSMAATKGAQMLYDEMVGKPGYDPRDRQKSKTLGVVSGEVGKMGSSRLKSGASGKGMRKKKGKLVIMDA